jgi:C4-dicarboxylate transporter DctQ subunit
MLQKVSAVLQRCTEVAMMVLMSCLVVIVVTSVIFRYILLSPIAWCDEVSRYLMIWLGFLGASIAMREKLHVSVEFVVRWAPPRIAAGLRGLAYGAMAGFLLIVMGYGFILVTNLWDQWSPILSLRMTWPYLAIPVGSLLMLIQMATYLGQRAESEGAHSC